MGFSDRDWGDTRSPRRRRRRRPTDPAVADAMLLLDPVPWVGRQRLAAVFATDPTVIGNVRRELADRLDRHCEVQGYTVDPESVSWDTWTVDVSGTMDIELRAELIPRMDGIWGEIRIALAEDAADRRDAAVTADDIDDRLDALRETVGVWTAKTPTEVREALGAPSPSARDPVPVDRPPSV